ncbi:hypothetical protein NS206_12930 [Microbacterium testaceum]|uniref:hypothetical protein n=1 Tax=Microbacterium testaceum TaxID=2033 RepID=UPI000734CAB4|nr:hypothetical protein [Microbacterium testaceum]KTS57754.1 hypothetical protein NS206_12930 [Microbacterium testaceum]
MTNNAVPANATPVGFDTWLTPGGDLYRSATKIATNVTAAVAQFVNNGSGAVGVKTSYQTSTAVFTHWSPDTGQSGYINMTTNGVPANATPVGFDTWLTPGGDLYRSATKIATNVTAAVAQFVNNGSGAVGVKTSYQTHAASC